MSSVCEYTNTNYTVGVIHILHITIPPGHVSTRPKSSYKFRLAKRKIPRPVISIALVVALLRRESVHAILEKRKKIEIKGNN